MSRKPTTSRKKREYGMSLIELMIAITVLVVGLCSVLALIMTATSSNNRNKLDTGGTLVAQMLMEAISNSSAAQITMKDCAGTVLTIATAPPATNGTSVGANLTSDNRGIDFSQAATSVAANYHVNYVSCGTGGHTATYDVRWNIYKISTYSSMVTVAARKSGLGTGSGITGGVYFAPPVNLRTVVSSN